MALTKNFRETIRDRAQWDPAFRRALLQEAIQLLLAGDVETGQALMRNYVNATVGVSSHIAKARSESVADVRPKGKSIC